MLGLGDLEHPHRSRDPGGPPAQYRLVERQWLALGTEEHLRACPPGGSLAAVVNAGGPVSSVEIMQERPAPDPRALRLDQAQHCLHRDRCIDRTSAAAKDRHPGLGGERVGGDDKSRGRAGRFR